MLDEYNNLNFKHDNREEALLERSDDQEEPLEVADQRKEHTEDTLSFLMCGEQEIFSHDSLTDFQLVEVVNAFNLVDPVGLPARNPETS